MKKSMISKVLENANVYEIEDIEEAITVTVETNKQYGELLAELLHYHAGSLDYETKVVNLLVEMFSDYIDMEL